MSRRLKILIGVLVAVLVLTLGATAIAFADNAKTAATDNTSPKSAFLDRIAQILNIDKQTLLNAFNQAQQEMRSDNQTRERKGLTEEQKEKVREKLEQMKEKMGELREQNQQKMLDKALEKGIITAAEKKQIEDWLASHPAAMDKLAPKGMFGPPGLGKKWPDATQNTTRPNAKPTNRLMPRMGDTVFR